MTKFTDVKVEADGTATLIDDRNHVWAVAFIGERPDVQQVFAADNPTDEPPEDETGDDEKEE